ncbi:dTDP-4-dehydrorhamnose 3,5-epimerase [Achromatium sp. WMS2]|nr:dTDP-4-dehydrorhamnose 3,5-epimerase [Achromatium sp. WMS2]
MEINATAIPEVLLITPKVFVDARGFFIETWQQHRYTECGIRDLFVQDNLASSTQGVLRGLHLQHPYSQGKLVQVLVGEVLDVAVDVRLGSPWFGKWVSKILSATNHQQFWIPPGFAHGYYVLSDTAIFMYKCTTIYHPECELSINWNDPQIAIEWPSGSPPIVSAKDQTAKLLADINPQLLPKYAK